MMDDDINTPPPGYEQFRGIYVVGGDASRLIVAWPE
jgi:hypothetical protein